MAFRADIEGLRAVAICAVLLAHAELTFAQGGFVGVDVFYVISGFLITGLLVREVERRGSISLAGFYARRARRLLPAAALVIVAVLLASAILFAPTRQELVIGDAVASSLYYVNWRFVAQSADYFGPPTDQSPLQHYWSLAVEEQFYLVWPLLLLGVAYLWMRRGRPMPRAAAASAIGAVTVVSFTYSALYEPTSSGEAFFSSFTRAWELGLGGLLAFLPATRLRPTPAAVLGFAGLGAIVLATLIFSPSTRFPGVAALLPCLGAAAIIRAGRADMPFRPLTLRPVRYVGKISYSWYLWHWPPLIFFATEFGPLSAKQGVALTLASFVPAALTHHLIERPIHRSSMLKQMPARSLAVGAACMVAGLVAAGAVAASLPDFETASARQAVGAKANRSEPIQETADAIRPNPLEAALDKGQLFADGCLVERPILASGDCSYGPDDASANVFLLGDSHGQQYFPALERIGRDKDWQITGLTKVGCTPASISVWSGSLKGPYPECDEWRENSLKRIEEGDPDLVVVSSASYYHVDDDGDKLGHLPSRPLLASAYEETLNRLLATGAEVVVMIDIPQAPFNVSDCVSENLDSLSECAFPLSDAVNKTHFDIPAAEAVPEAHSIEIQRVMCPDRVCRAVIGNVLVYRETNHVTATFSETLSDYIEERLPKVP